MLAPIAVLAAVAALAYACYYYRSDLALFFTSEQARNDLMVFVKSHRVEGFLIVFGLMSLQIVLAFIPGELVEIMAGTAFGVWGGLALCLLSICVSAVAINYSVKAFGAKQIDEAKFVKYRFLNNRSKIEGMLFLLFFIPGTPKDFLCYLAPFLPIKFKRFLTIMLIARIPSVITSTIAGANLIKGNFTIVIVVLVATGIIALLAIINNERILSFVAARAGKNAPPTAADNIAATGADAATAEHSNTATAAPSDANAQIDEHEKAQHGEHENAQPQPDDESDEE